MTTNEPNLSDVSTKKVLHAQLVLSGVCTRCAHCSLPLTDAVSIERGLGGTCSKKGYHEDPIDGDEMQAFIELSDYPELVSFLTEHYKPQGLRGLMNGLVKVCALNRHSPVHKACCNAIESLGFRRLASTLRKSLASVFVTDSTDYPGHLEVRVLWRDYNANWKSSLQNTAYGVFYAAKSKTMVIPVHKPDDKEQIAVNKDGTPNRKALWDSLVEFYEGMIVCLPDGNIEIKRDPQKVA